MMFNKDHDLAEPNQHPFLSKIGAAVFFLTSNRLKLVLMIYR